MVGYKTGKDRYQETFLPSRLDDYVDENHPCRAIDAFIDSLDLRERGFKHTQPQYIGSPSYNPGDMTKLYLYGYLNHIRSSRKMNNETRRNVEVMWLINGLTPDDKTICNFRADNAKALKEVFRDFNKLCLKLDLFGQETVSIDGTKIKADNARKNHYTREGIEKSLNKLEKQITEYFNDIERNDQAEEKEAKIDMETAAEMLVKMNKRKDRLEDILKEINENGGHPVCTIDNDAALMKQGSKGFDVCYNVQTSVDEKHGLVVDFNVTNNCNDLAELSDMVGRSKEMLEVGKIKALADGGYSSGKEIYASEKLGATCYIPKSEASHQPEDKKYHRDNFIYDTEKDQYICPEGNIMGYVRTRDRDGYRVYANRSACMNCPAKPTCTKSSTLREMERNPYQEEVERANANAKENPDLYKRRKELSEHPFGVVKRKWNYYQYILRGKEKVTGETALMFLAFNFRRVLNILGVKKIIESLV